MGQQLIAWVLPSLIMIGVVWMMAYGTQTNAWQPAELRSKHMISLHRKGGILDDSRSKPCLSMIGNLFSNSRQDTSTASSSSSNTKSTTPSLPRDVKQAVAVCRQATQEALKQRTSRMDITFPVGTKFGVEKISSKAKKGQALSPDQGKAPTAVDLQRSNRELARLFVDMFQPVGGDRIVVSFTDIEQADFAKQQWKDDSSATCRIMSMDRRRTVGASAGGTGKKGGKAPKQSSRGFAAKLAAELDEVDASGATVGSFMLPDNIEVAIFVAPGSKELPLIEKTCQSVGMGTLVILLNARLDTISNFGSQAAKQLFTEQFESVFCLAAVTPQDVAPNGLLYRSYPGPWILARKPSAGAAAALPPKTILVQGKRPTAEECRVAFDALELSAVEKSVESAIDNISQWFR